MGSTIRFTSEATCQVVAGLVAWTLPGEVGKGWIGEELGRGGMLARLVVRDHVRKRDNVAYWNWGMANDIMGTGERCICWWHRSRALS